MRLREVRQEDHEWLVSLHNDPQVLTNMTHPEPITVIQHLEWWERVSKNNAQKRLIFEIGADTRVGFTKFYDIDHVNRNCVLGADIHKDHRGRGYAKDMWTLMLNECFGPMNMHRVGLTTAEYNTIAQRVYWNLGFKGEGRMFQSLYRDGKFHDQICMYMLKNDWKP